MAPPPPETGDDGGADRSLGLLLAVGGLLLLWCLFLNRISLGGPVGLAPPWIQELAQPFGLVWSKLFGPLAVDDWDVTGQRVRLGQYIRGSTLVFLAFLPLAWAVARARLRVSQRGYEVILVVAIVARILPVFSPPLLETDPYRYLWDGTTLVAGVNPYRYAPAEVLTRLDGRAPPHPDPGEERRLQRLMARARDPRVAHALRLVNHPDLNTVYPPVAQLLFGLSSWLAPGSVVVLKALVALVDLGVLAALAWLLRLLGRRRELLLLYAWCPLVLKEFSGSAHYDALASLCLLVSLGLLLCRRRGAAGVLLGLAVMSKVYPLLAGLVLFRRYGRRGLGLAAATMGLLMVPVVAVGPRALEGLLVFGTRWVKNASLFSLVRWPFLGLDVDPVRLPLPTLGGWTPPPLPLDSLLVAKLVLVPLALGGLVWLARRPEDGDAGAVRRVHLALAILMLTSPVGNPWYLAWVLPFAALEGSLAWPLLAAGSTGYYAYHFQEAYGFACSWIPGGMVDVRWLEYLPGYGVLAAEVAAGGRADAGTRASSTATSRSNVVTPSSLSVG